MNFILTEDYHINYGLKDTKVLPKGAFVQPLHPAYVPDHVKQNKMWLPFNPETDTYAYTRFGIIALPKDRLKET